MLVVVWSLILNIFSENGVLKNVIVSLIVTVVFIAGLHYSGQRFLVFWSLSEHGIQFTHVQNKFCKDLFQYNNSSFPPLG